MIAYSRHLLRAKGRHGTHSPFVYAFVEQVMRSRSRMPAAVAGMTQKEANLLFRTLCYLKPQVICATPAWMPVMAAIKPFLPWDTVLTAGVYTAVASAGAVLIVTDMEQEQPDPSVVFTNADRLSILCIRPHRSKYNLLLWEQAAAAPAIQVSLDYWHFGLLVRDASFKAKQHFRLR